MNSLYAIITITILLLIYTFYKSRIFINNKESMFADVFIIISSVFGSFAILNFTLTTKISKNIEFYYTTFIFLGVAIITLVCSYFIYFHEKDKKLKNFLWLSSEFFMSLGITIILMSIVYISTLSGHIPNDIIQENFYALLFSKDGKKVIENIHLAGNIFSLILGILFVTIAFLINGYKCKKYK